MVREGGRQTFGDVSGVTAADVERQPVERFWRGRFIRGSLNLLVGPPKSGKSLGVIEISADWTGRDGPVILSSADPPAVQRDRVEAARADVRRVRLVGYRLPRDLEQVEEDVREWSALHSEKPVLVTLDGGSNQLPRHAAQLEDTLAALDALLERTGATAILVTDALRVAVSADPLTAMPAILASRARSIAFFVYDPADHGCRLCVWAADQYGEPPPPLALEFAGVDLPYAEAQAFVSSLLVREHDGAVPNPIELLVPRGAKGPALFDAELAEAAEWLTNLLAAGPMAVEQNVGMCPTHGHVACDGGCCPACRGMATQCVSIKSEARDSSVSWAAIRRAETAIGIQKERHFPLGRKRPEGSLAYWRLPDGHPNLAPYASRVL